MSGRPHRRRGRVVAAVVAIGLGLMSGLLTAAPAGALPPGGPSPDTPGTASSVWPTTLAAGGTIHFRVSGYPAGQIVYVKIDDGAGYSDQTVQGAGVVAAQKIGSDGVATGSFELPPFLAPGAHWLRYLASEPIMKNGEQVGVLGYTRRGGSDFTVVAASATTSTAATSARPSTPANGSGSATSTHPTPASTSRSTGRPTTAAPAGGATTVAQTTATRPPPAQSGGTGDPSSAGSPVDGTGSGSSRTIGSSGVTASASEANTLPVGSASVSSAPPTGEVLQVPGGEAGAAATSSMPPTTSSDASDATGPADTSTPAGPTSAAGVAPTDSGSSAGGGGFPLVGTIVLGVVAVLVAVGGWLLLRRPGRSGAAGTASSGS